MATQQLELNSIGSWPFAYRLGVILAACVALFIIGYFFLISDSLDSLNNANSDETKNKNEFKTKFDQSSNLEAFKTQLQQMQIEFEASLKQLPSDNQLPELIQELSNQALMSGLSSPAIKPLKIEKKEFYQEQSLDISTSGGYHNIGEFISGISYLPRIVTLHDFNMSAVGSSSSGAVNQQGVNNQQGWSAPSTNAKGKKNAKSLINFQSNTNTDGMVTFSVTGKTYWSESGTSDQNAATPNKPVAKGAPGKAPAASAPHTAPAAPAPPHPSPAAARGQ